MREAARYEWISRLVAYGNYDPGDPGDPGEKASSAVRFRNELLAIAALIEAHQDEFDDLCEGLTATGDLTAKRRARRAAEGHAKGIRQ